jgi:hypothetical protein
MNLQWLDQRAWKNRYAILAALAVSDQDLSVAEIHILNTQLQALAKTQACAIQEACHQPTSCREVSTKAGAPLLHVITVGLRIDGLACTRSSNQGNGAARTSL